MPKCIKVPHNFIIQYTNRRKWKQSEIHTHDCYELYYLMEGNLSFDVDNKNYCLNPGSIALFSPGTEHCAKLESEPQHKRMLIYLKKQYLKEFLSIDPALLDFFDKPVINLMLTQRKRVEDLFELLLSEYYCDNRSMDAIMIKALLGQLFSLIKRYKTENDMLKPQSTLMISSKKIAKAVAYINENYQKDIRLRDIADMLDINYAYLSRNFKDNVGCNCSEYITKVRLHHAVIMLLDTDKNISQIASDVGFNSGNHFCKTFRKIIGVSPLRYRRNV